MNHSDTPAGVGPVDAIDELELLKLGELAELWKVSKRTIELLVSTGELPSEKVGWNRRVRRRDAVAYLQRRRVSSSP